MVILREALAAILAVAGGTWAGALLHSLERCTCH
jgi:hypothetical protein